MNNFFTDVTGTAGLFQDDLTTYGATFGDIDNDGDLDLFICNREDNGHVGRNYLYRNDNGTFTDVTLANGISMTSALTFVASFFPQFERIMTINNKMRREDFMV